MVGAETSSLSVVDVGSSEGTVVSGVDTVLGKKVRSGRERNTQTLKQGERAPASGRSAIVLGTKFKRLKKALRITLAAKFEIR